MSDTLDPLVRVAKRLQAEAEEIGLTQVHFSVHPSLDGGDHHIQVAFCLKDEPTAPDPTFAEIANRLEGEIEEQRQAEEAKRAEKEKAQLRDFFKELSDPSKGIGLEER